MAGTGSGTGTEQPDVGPSSSSIGVGGESQEEANKWGTHVMGAPAAPTVHPDNQKAALWNAADHQQPYVQYEPVEKPTTNPLEPVINLFHSWSTKAETIARNIWHNRKQANPTSSSLASDNFYILFCRCCDVVYILCRLFTVMSFNMVIVFCNFA